MGFDAQGDRQADAPGWAVTLEVYDAAGRTTLFVSDSDFLALDR